MKKRKVLFVCIENSARSQMAEAFLRDIAPDRFEVDSAGIEPGELNKLAVEVMEEIGLDISGNRTKSVLELRDQGREYDVVVTVCDASEAGRCPVLARGGKHLRWSFDDPASFTGPREQKLEQTRRVRDAIRETVEKWVAGPA